MRRQLIMVFAAMAALIVIAFVIPLGYLIQRTAEDRAVDAARADISAMIPVLAISNQPELIQAQMLATKSGRDRHMTIVLPDGEQVGRPVADRDELATTIEQRQSAIGPVADDSGDVEVIQVVGIADEQVAGLRVLVTKRQLRSGVSTAFTALAMVGVALIAVGVFAADRLARSVVLSTQRLAQAADALGSGDLDARVEPDGPPELKRLATTFNALGGQVGGMLDRERALVANMSHRLRTPLTRLRLRIDQVESSELATDLSADLTDATQALSELINDARLSLDQRAALERCDAAAVTAERVDFWAVLADDQDRAMHRRIPDFTVMVQMSTQALTEAIDILFDNVFSHTEPGTPFEVGVRATELEAAIWVADAGPGWQAGSANGKGPAGTGIGLSIALLRTKARGGRVVTSQSELGGAHAELIIPRARG